MPRFYSIRFRLTVTFLIIILLVMIFISLFLYNMLERYHLSNLQDNLQRYGLLASEFVVGQLRGEIDSVRLSALAENMSRQAQARVIFTDQQGIVIGDSLIYGGLLNQKLDVAAVTTALDGSISSNLSYSERIQHQVLQMAIPVYEGEESVIGVVFLTASLEDLNIVLADIRRFLFLSTIMAIVVVGSGSVLLARRFTVPLEELTTASKRMAEGKLDQHIEFSSRDEIGRLADQFNIMARRLNYYTSNLKKFVADVAHEVRTPLTTMNLLTGSLKEHEMEPQQQKEFIEDLDQELKRLIDLVNDLLELSKLEKGDLENEKIILDSLILDLVSQNEFRFDQAGLDLIISTHDQQIQVLGVPSQLRQVISNLLDNAFNYTLSGGMVKISLYSEGSEAVVSVQDTGCGIPKEDLDYIFERFFRVERARSREGGGTGLGLAIVSEIISRHNGRVWVESSEGEGSIFYFALNIVDD